LQPGRILDLNDRIIVILEFVSSLEILEHRNIIYGHCENELNASWKITAEFCCD